MEFRCAAICRLCLSENDCFFSIFVANKKYGYIPSIVISELLAVQVSETDGYPHVICLPCLDKLTDYKSFKEQCLAARSNFDKSCNSSSLLQGTVKEGEIKDEPADLEPIEEVLDIKQESLDFEEDKLLDQISAEYSSTSDSADQSLNLPSGSPHVIRSIRGKEKLVDTKKYIYSRKMTLEQKNEAGGTKMYWKCEVRDCKARVHTLSSNQNNYEIIKTIGHHHHSPSPIKPKIRKLLDEMKLLALSTDLSVQDLISSVLQNLDEGEVCQLPSVSRMGRNIRYWRQVAKCKRDNLHQIRNT